MNANEIRIGNLYDHNGEIREVTPSTIEEVWNSERSWVKPIRLTEDICDRFGCSYGFGAEPRFELTDSISMSILFINGNILCLIGDDLQVQIEFVHQLQNLYFALIGQELTYKRQRMKELHKKIR